jgi:OMF family outer membrane factor
MAKLVQTTSILFEQQLAKRSDVDRTKLQLDQLNSKRTTLHAQYRQVVNVLGFLMGKPLTDSLEVKPVTTSFTETIYQPRHITELKLIEKKLELNQSELSGLKLSRLPSIGAYAMYGTSGMGNTGENSFFNFYPIGFVGAQISFPLFNGTITQRRINQKKIEIRKTSLQQSMAIDKNRMEAENARKQHAAAKEFAATTLVQIKLAREIYNNTVLQNQQGVANLTDVLLADNSLREAQQNYSSALIGLFKAELEMQRVTGNLTNK